MPVKLEPSPLIVPLKVALPVTAAVPVTVKLFPTLKLPVASVTLPTLNALYATNSITSPSPAAVVKLTVLPSVAV